MEKGGRQCRGLLSTPSDFNSTSVEPDPPVVGESVSYEAVVDDPDGEIDDTCLDLTYGGELVYSECRVGENPTWSDVFTPEESDQWLNATFTATDTDGGTTTEELNYYLDNVPPEANFSFSPDLEMPGTEIEFSDETVSEEGIVSWNWDFGDGATSTDENPTHSYEEHGDYTVELTVEDVYGVTDTATKTVQVNSVPEADFGYSPSIDFVGQEIQFSDESTDAYSSIESVMWNFGDSTTSTGSSPSHTYTEPGTYEIELTVEDEHGAINTRTVEAEVESALNAEYSYEPVQPEIGEEIEFVDESSNEYAEIESVEWSFGVVPPVPN